MKKWDENKIQNNDSPKRVDIINLHRTMSHVNSVYTLWATWDYLKKKSAWNSVFKNERNGLTNISLNLQMRKTQLHEVVSCSKYARATFVVLFFRRKLHKKQPLITEFFNLWNSILLPTKKNAWKTYKQKNNESWRSFNRKFDKEWEL